MLICVPYRQDHNYPCDGGWSFTLLLLSVYIFIELFIQTYKQKTINLCYHKSFLAFQIAAKCTEEKGKFFTPEVNLKLISLDNGVRQIGSVVSRNNVYSHLSSYLPINRETLMKRMKLLRQKELTDRLQEPIDKLKQGITPLTTPNKLDWDSVH